MDGGERGVVGDGECHKDIDAMQPCGTWPAVALSWCATCLGNATNEGRQSRSTAGGHGQVQEDARRGQTQRQRRRGDWRGAAKPE